MEERKRFVKEARKGRLSIGELSQRYGVSRKTAYKWLARYRERGWEGLADRSRAPRGIPHQTSDELVEAIVEARRSHPRWGARTLRAWLARQEPSVSWPAASTVGEILKRQGLIKPRRRRRKRPRGKWKGVGDVKGPQVLLSADFKGQFKTRDGRYCFPLTVADYYSRYLLVCEALPSTAGRYVEPLLRRLFKRYGLPEAILTDNGVPFAGPGLAGLSRLSVGWLRLGIRALLIQPGHPEQNGRHERMHRTLKEETALPPAANHREQQRCFDRFREIYNEQRPHQALGERTPAEFYRPSSRRYPRRLTALNYPGHYEIRRVSSKGDISWRGRHIFLTEVLEGHQVGLEEIRYGIWSIYFGTQLLGRFDEKENRVYG